MVIAVARYASLAIDAARVLHYLARFYDESTPQERAAMGNHLQEIWEILKNAAKRSAEVRQTPALLMPPPGETSWGSGGANKRRRVRVMERSKQVRKNVREFAGLIRRYQSDFTGDEAREVTYHLDATRIILAGINRRTRK